MHMNFVKISPHESQLAFLMSSSLLLCITPVLQGVAVSTATCVQLHKRAEKIAAALTEKGSINTGENVVLLYPPGGFCVWLPVCGYA